MTTHPSPPCTCCRLAVIATESCASLIHPAPHMTSPSYMAINTLTHVHKHTQIGHTPSCESCEPCSLIPLLTLNLKRIEAVLCRSVLQTSVVYMATNSLCMCGLRNVYCCVAMSVKSAAESVILQMAGTQLE